MKLYKRRHRKFYSLVMSLILTLSLFTPQIARADMQDIKDLNTLEEDLLLEKQMEEGIQTNDYEDIEVFSEDGLPRLMNGLDVDHPDFLNTQDAPEEKGFDKEDFTLDGKVEKVILQSLEKEKTVDVIIHMKDKSNKGSLFNEAAKVSNRIDRLEMVQSQLQNVAKQAQAKVLENLQSLEKKGQATDIKALWIINAVATQLTEDALYEIYQRDDVERIVFDEVYEVPEVMESETEPRLPEWGLEKINATDVWGQYGIDGEGIVVGIMDTGVEGSHEALAENYRGQDGNHKSSWIDLSGDGYNTPGDGHGHGTHVAGSAVGGGEGEPVGVAPGAEWIAAKIFNDRGSATESGIHQAFEWFMAPGGDAANAPHVVNNSWGNSDTFNTQFHEDVQAWVTAGIFPLFAAGNDGPGSTTIGSPASFPESFAIGATDINDQIAWFSSRGPVIWEGERYIKPEVSAPGDEIYSAWPGNGYNTISGTSMATPHVAGTIALILQANPDLTIDEVKGLLMNTVRTESHMGELPNDLYGNGIVDAYRAVTEAAFAGSVQGKLVDQNEEGIEGIILIEDENIRIDVPEDGSFQFKLREGTHDVVLQSFGYYSDNLTLTVTKDETVEVNWELEAATRFELSGTIQTEGGSPVPYAYIRIQDTPLKAVRTDANGDFRVSDIPEGEYQLSITGKNISGKEEVIQVNENQELNISVTESEAFAVPDWLTANNNNGRNAISHEDISSKHLEKTWSYGASGNIIFSSPVVNDDTIVFTTDQGNVQAIDRHTGEEKWRFRTAGLNRSTPTITDEHVFVAGGQDGKLYALEIDTGAVLWEVLLDNAPIYETPLYEEGKLYLSSNINGETHLLALDAETGEELWQKAVGAESYFGAALADDQIVLGTYSDSTLHALSTNGGEDLWTFKASGEGFASNPVIVDGMVYAFSSNFDTERGTLWAIDGTNGEEIWHVDGIGDTQAASPVVYEDIIIVSSASNPSLKAFDRNSGLMLWENKAVNTTVNNGAVASNGVFFMTDSAGTLKAIDVFTGNILSQWGLDGTSSSTPAIISGQLIIGKQSGINVYAAPGILSGTIQDTDGNPIEGIARVLGTDDMVEANKEGKFELIAQPGELNVKVGKYGLEQVLEEVDFRSGYTHEKTYTLAPVEEGQLTGQITDQRGGQVIEDVTVMVQDTPLDTTTDAEGHFTFDNISAGSYELVVSASGYVTKKATVEINAHENTTFDMSLDPVDVAVLNDYENTITDILNKNGIPAEEKEWTTIIEEIENYQVLYLNGAYRSGGWQPEKEDIDALLAAAQAHDVSVVFAEAWGPSYGTIEHLTAFYEDPSTLQSDHTDSIVSLVVEQEHPIFDGFEKGDRIRIMNNGSMTWFNGYSGRDLATIGSHRLGDVGTGIGYKAVTQNSAHLLLSTHATASWNLPTQHWLKEQHDLLINGISYLVNHTEYGQLNGRVVDQNGDPLEVKVEVVDTGAIANTSEDGRFELYHDEGTFEVEVRLTGYQTETIEVAFEHGEIATEEIQLLQSNEGQLSGEITDSRTSRPVGDVDVILLDQDGEIVKETTSSQNGNYLLEDLSAAKYSVEFKHNDYVLDVKETEISGQPAALNVALTPAPRVAIIGDRSYGENLESLLAEINIGSTNYRTSAELTEDMEQYDVVFFNSEGRLSQSDFEALEKAADEHGVSIIYGDSYFSGGGIDNLVKLRGNPATKEDANIRSSSAQYLVDDSHPVFGEAEAGDVIDILTPSGSRVTTFDGYEGYTLADIKHAENNEVHGPGVAFMPRTGESLELLMSGHNIGIGHYADDYTEAGLNMFTDAIIWAAYQEFNVIQGTVTDEEGQPLDAEVSVEVDGITIRDQTTAEDGQFSIASLDGDVLLTVTSYGYDSQSFTIRVEDGMEPMSIPLLVKDDVGALEGIVTNSMTMSGIEGAQIDIVDHPRETTTDTQGRYRIDTLEPGTYDIVVTKDEYVQQQLTIDIEPGETNRLDIQLRPSPTVGIIVDSQSSSAMPLSDYLENRGINTVSMFYDDLDMLDEVDLVFANSDYNNSLIPDEQTFKDFIQALDDSETSVIWTGQHGGRGSIRYMVDYIGDPGMEYRGSGSGTQTAQVLEDHPIFEGVPDTFEFTNRSGYYYGFDDYNGTILADYDHPGVDEEGNMIGLKGRTINSVEILLAGMTIGFGFHEGNEHFDENREKIINNAILWAIDNKESYAGEVRGSLINNMDNKIQGKVVVEETGQTALTDNEGKFFLGLAEGSYNLRIESFGHVTNTFEVAVENGQVLEDSFVLDAENVGEVTGEVVSSVTGNVIEDATIEVLDTPLKSKTDDEGKYTIILPEGEYQLRFTASTHQPQTITVSVEADKTTNADVSLGDSEAIAVIVSSYNQNRIVPFLEANGYEVTTFDQSEHGQVKENIAEFALVIFNDSGRSMSETDFRDLIDAADEAMVSMVFASQWGGGSISHLEDYLGDPESTQSGYVPDAIYYEVLEEHPIFRGYEAGDTFMLLDREGSNQQYGVFENYSGTMLADVVHPDEGRLGGGLAYDFRSSSHVHVLLGSLAVGSYGNPEDRWTEDASNIYINAIDWALSASLGEIQGAIQNEAGEPIQGARVTVEEQGITAASNDQGHYTIGVGTGEYTVSVQAIGYEPMEQTVRVESIGDVAVLDFTLARSEEMTLFGSVSDLSTNEGMEGVSIEVFSENQDLSYDAITDGDGSYQVAGLLEGDYTVIFEKDGYHPVTRQVTIEESTDLELNVDISSYNIAVLGDYKGMISNLLNEHDLAAEQVDWDVIDHVEHYEVIIVNASKGSTEDMEALIAKSDEHQTSLVFLDTWGAESGAIHLLEKALGHPAHDQHGYNEGEVFIQTGDTAHPIFEGFHSNERTQVLAAKSPYATFKDYDGTVIGELAVGEEDKGASIGYEYRSGEHVHLLLSVFAVNNMIGPDQGWTADGKQLFVQAIEWSKSAKLEPPNAPEWLHGKERFNQGDVIVEGTADPMTTVRVLENEALLAEVTADENGVFKAELDLALGSYKIDAEAVNAAGSVRSKNKMHVIVIPGAGKPGMPPGKQKLAR